MDGLIAQLPEARRAYLLRRVEQFGKDRAAPLCGLPVEQVDRFVGAYGQLLTELEAWIAPLLATFCAQHRLPLQVGQEALVDYLLWHHLIKVA
jgi:phosphoserine phosphatase